MKSSSTRSLSESFDALKSAELKKLYDKILKECISPSPSKSTIERLCGMNISESINFLDGHFNGYSKPASAHSEAILIAWAWCVKNTSKPEFQHEKNIMLHTHNVLHGLYLSQIELDKFYASTK